MKLIVTRDFRNNFGAEVKDPIHEHHIHKGAILEIGPAGLEFSNQEHWKRLSGDERKLIANLHGAKCVGDGSNEKLVKQIQSEAAAEKAAAEKAAKTTMAAGSAADVLKQLLDSGVIVLNPDRAKAA